MAQDDYNIPNQSFPSFRSDLNSALSAINSCNSGTSRPSSAVAGTIWLDTSGGVTAYVLKFFDGSDDITLANINTTANTVDFVDSSVASDLLNDTTPQLGGQLDVNGNAIGDGTLELLKFIETGSAINEFTITNSATGSSPELSSTGDDSNINLKLKPKGTGNIEVMGATNPGSIQLNCENNSHGIKLTSPPHSSGQSYELKFPTGNVTAGKVLKVDSVSGSGTTGIGQLTFGDASGGTSWQSSIKTANFTAVAGEGYWVNTSGGAITVTFPSSASVGDTIELSDYDRSWSTNNLTINRNGLNFQGGTQNAVYDVDGQSVRIVYSGSTKGWIPTSDDDVSNEGALPYTVDFLCIAGGGAGGSASAGGGGAGGYRNSYSNEASGGGGSSETVATVFTGSVYTITIGQGGTGDSPSSSAGGDGNDSSIAGAGLTTITSVGGGGGGSTPANQGQDGGSGGGAGRTGTSSPYVGSGTTNQGYNGGVSTGTPEGTCGGGGGATENGGTDGTGTGGDGLSSSITGSAVTRGGGGAGAKDYPTPSALAGGEGGGGNGGVGDAGTNAQDGSANTGGGGGGGRSTGADNGGGHGGSGVVILRMATSNYSGTTSGSPTVTTSGSDTILTFNASGSYTA